MTPQLLTRLGLLCLKYSHILSFKFSDPFFSPRFVLTHFGDGFSMLLSCCAAWVISFLSMAPALTEYAVIWNWDQDLHSCPTSYCGSSLGPLSSSKSVHSLKLTIFTRICAHVPIQSIGVTSKTFPPSGQRCQLKISTVTHFSATLLHRSVHESWQTCVFGVCEFSLHLVIAL